MLQGCNSLTELDLSNFDISKVTDIQWLYKLKECKSVKQISNRSK